MNAKSNYTYPASDMQLHASDAAGLMKRWVTKVA